MSATYLKMVGGRQEE